jgi:hypothetical protein
MPYQTARAPRGIDKHRQNFLSPYRLNQTAGAQIKYPVQASDGLKIGNYF